MTLTAGHIAETQEEKIEVVESLVARQCALAHAQPGASITHDVRLELIGRQGEYVQVNRFDTMTKLFSELQISNIHIQHFCVSEDNDPLSSGDAVEAGPYAFLISDVLSWFTQEIREYSDEDKLRMSQALGMFLVFTVKTSFTEHFEQGVSLAHRFMEMLAQLPGMDTLKHQLKHPPAVIDLSSVCVARTLFRHIYEQTPVPDDDILVLTSQEGRPIAGIDELIQYFSCHDDVSNIMVSCSFSDYISEKVVSKEVIRLSDLISVVATLLPEGECDSVTSQLLAFVHHVCNSNLKGAEPMSDNEMLRHLLQCKQHINKQKM